MVMLIRPVAMLIRRMGWVLRSRIVTVLACCLAEFGLRPLSHLAAQTGTAAIVGRIVDRQTHGPVRAARLALTGTSLGVDSDSAGRFTREGLRAGEYRLEARAIGYAVGSWSVELHGGEILRRDFALEPLPVPLDPVVVEGRPTFAQQRLRDLERRRASGRGYFLSEAQIEHAHPRTLADLLRNVPGVRLVCRGSSNCTIRMSRAPRECRPDFVLDGFPATNSTSLDMPAVGIIDVEVYRTLSETPMEFLKADNQCGTIVLWSRSGPTDH